MAINMKALRPFIPIILSSITLFGSLSLIGISSAIFHPTLYGMRQADKAFLPVPGRYTWYRGPGRDPDTLHQVTLQYDNTTENFILAGAVIGCLTGLIGVIGTLVTWKTEKSTSTKLNLYAITLPGLIAFIATLISFVGSFVIYGTDNSGKCYWEDGYEPENIFMCSRELAMCNIVGYFKDYTWQKVLISQAACDSTRVGRILTAPLFVASVLMFGPAVAKGLLARKGQTENAETADDRVERLQREE